MKISVISQTKAKEIVKLRAKENFKNMQDLRERVKGVFENPASLLIEF
jgi:DNA uptake protein ComE-like DNA-binding protein